MGRERCLNLQDAPAKSIPFKGFAAVSGVILLQMPVHPRQVGSANLATPNVLFWRHWTLKFYYFSFYC